MRVRLQELQETHSEAQELRQQKADGYEKIDDILHYQGLPFVPKAIETELISRHHNNPLAGHFGIEKTCKLLAQKYYWPTLCHNVKAYVKGCNICLASKAFRHKLYGGLQSLPVPSHWWKDLSIDFLTGLPVSIDWKGDSYNFILVIVDWLTKMVYYKPVKITLNITGLAEVIIGVIICHQSFPDSIVTNQSSLFTLKFWSSLCYFLGIKRTLSTTFHP